VDRGSPEAELKVCTGYSYEPRGGGECEEVERRAQRAWGSGSATGFVVAVDVSFDEEPLCLCRCRRRRLLVMATSGPTAETWKSQPWGRLLRHNTSASCTPPHSRTTSLQASRSPDSAGKPPAPTTASTSYVTKGLPFLSSSTSQVLCYVTATTLQPCAHAVSHPLSHAY
jgi:hypothetical protein